MRNGTRASIHGVGTVDLKLTSRKIVRLQNVQHAPSINKNLVSGLLLLRDGYKLVFESNKLVVSHCGQFIGKEYDSGGLFRLSLMDVCSSVVNHASVSINNDEVDVWHSHARYISSHDIVVPHEQSTPADYLEQSLEEDDSEIAPRKSKRQRISKSFGDDFSVYLVDDTPRSISEVFASSDADDWKEAVRSEMDSIMTNGTWEIVDRPFGCKPVGCERVFKKKLRPDGTIVKYM
ncbi:hypothetical protein U9M48_024735 [Paspalum notatum var. saurae]|uniref:Retrovirus-related Pol polyprotein from transposon TNT 1-94-like beta-barrel domain-containing protein n=1 Tax=Paspalum notatum var. saurae TaxID=547442 RepID=A0AAQ3TTK9_PASNO